MAGRPDAPCMALIAVLFAAVAAWARAAAAVPPAAAVSSGSAAWTLYQQAASGVAYGGGSVPSSVLAHVFRTPLDAILASNVYSGSNARLRRTVRDLQDGKAIKVVAIGGLATNGTAATQPGRNDYFAQFVSYLQQVCVPPPPPPPPGASRTLPEPSAAGTL